MFVADRGWPIVMRTAILAVVASVTVVPWAGAGASHCTSDKAIALFKQAFGEDFVPLGVGKVDLPLEWTTKP